MIVSLLASVCLPEGQSDVHICPESSWRVQRDVVPPLGICGFDYVRSTPCVLLSSNVGCTVTAFSQCKFHELCFRASDMLFRAIEKVGSSHGPIAGDELGTRL